MIQLICFEFNTRPRGGEVEVRHYDEDIYVLNENHRDVVSPLYEEIRIRFPQAYEDLCLRYKESIQNIWYFEFRVVCGFIKCNWGSFDNKWDIDDNGEWHFEFIICPLAGECKSEGRICNPTEKLVILDGEMRVLKLIGAGKRVIEIADELSLSPKTVENHTNSMFRKLGYHNKSQLVDYAHRKGIL